MAGERTLPGLGLYGYWTLGSNGYKDQLDGNLRLLSALVQPNAIDRSATLPGSPTDGDIHVATGAWGGGAANDIMIYDNAAWVAVTPVEGWTIYDKDTNERLEFDGSAWAAIATGGGSSAMVQGEVTTSRALAPADKAGNIVRRVNSSSAVTITVPSGVSGTEPCTWIGVGTGTVTFAAGSGVTIHSADSNLSLRGQYSSAALIPDSSAPDTYYLLGDLG